MFRHSYIACLVYSYFHETWAEVWLCDKKRFLFCLANSVMPVTWIVSTSLWAKCELLSILVSISCVLNFVWFWPNMECPKYTVTVCLHGQLPLMLDRRRADRRQELYRSPANVRSVWVGLYRRLSVTERRAWEHANCMHCLRAELSNEVIVTRG